MSGSSPFEYQVRPLSVVTKSSTAAGPFGPASSTSYLSPNLGLATGIGGVAGSAGGLEAAGADLEGSPEENGLKRPADPGEGSGSASSLGIGGGPVMIGDGADRSASVEAKELRGGGVFGSEGDSEPGTPSGMASETVLRLPALSETDNRTFKGSAVPASQVSRPIRAIFRAGTWAQSLAPMAWYSSRNVPRSM